ncbi:FtsX-like permease family protein [Amycolatopsis speibonae]|uniref:FtsX-like permease family protein n=1 Tax=Amycolatopsis speibonae TaxID=1450224 RepID=A0ABV7P9B9_9PSEU
MTVKERRAEIAPRRALGARKRHITCQFVAEAAIS